MGVSRVVPKDRVKEQARAAWHASGMKTISFHPYDTAYENECFEKWWEQGLGQVDIERLQSQSEAAKDACFRVMLELIRSRTDMLFAHDHLDPEDLRKIAGEANISTERYDG